MEYSLIKPAVYRILNEVKSENGFQGWANPSSNLSRTVTAQVINTLSKCSKFEVDDKKKKLILQSIQSGFDYLKHSISNGNSEFPTFTFTLIAHLEHHKRYNSIYPIDVELIEKCISEIIDNRSDFYYDREKAYQYSNNVDRKYFPTFLAVQTFISLLNFLETNSNITLKNLTKDRLLSEIDNCFIYIYKKLNKKIQEANNLEFHKCAEYLTVGIQCSKYYEKYSNKYNRIPNITNIEYNLNFAIDYFTANLETLYNKWHIIIDRTPFDLIYISNIIAGLMDCRKSLSEKGLTLLYNLANFICTDDRIQSKDTNGNILYTQVPKNPIWATAHSLNGILKLHCSLTELKWSIQNANKPEQEEYVKDTTTEIKFHFFKSIIFPQIVLPIFTGLISSLIFTKYLIDKVDSSKYILITFILLLLSTFIYFIPKIILELSAKFFKLSRKYEKHLAVIGYILMIIAYLIIIYHYTFNKH